MREINQKEQHRRLDTEPDKEHARANPAGQRESQQSHKEEARTIRVGSIAQVIIAIAVVLAICYLAKLVLVTIFTSVLIAFMLQPVVRSLRKINVPQSLASAIAVLILLAMLYGLSYFFYQRAVDFAHDIPKYSGKIRDIISKYQQKAESLQQSTQDVLPQNQEEKNVQTVRVQEGSAIAGILGRNVGSFTEVALTLAFIPFLVFFMLTWQQHAKAATVRLFDRKKRPAVYHTVMKIADMMRTFITGNFIMGAFMAVLSIAVFGVLKLPFFYFIGVLSGFLSIVPYLGVILALLPPVAVGLGRLSLAGLGTVVITVLGLHVFSVNVLYPKVIGKRLQLNPLVVTLALLVWGWIWGAMGLVLAVPITATTKIICDNVENLKPFGEWLGD